ncbi:MAG: 2Fe-2S iron-sulfur cluster binding domain-containing protein [Polyangia bacterium]
MARVTYLPLETSVELEPHESIFAAARRNKLPVSTACAGKGTCGLCRVKIVSGEEHLGPITAVEKRHLGNTYFLTKLRLSCQLHPVGDVTVELPAIQVKMKP